MRNRQAQFIPASSEPLGLIKPIDPKYGYMAQPKKAESVLVKPMDRVSNLYTQSVQLNNAISQVEMDYQSLYDDLNNYVSSLPGGMNTFLSSTDPEVKKTRDSFANETKVLNQRRSMIEAAKGTAKSNYNAWVEDEKLPADRIAITSGGVTAKVQKIDEKTGKVISGEVNMNPFELLKRSSNLIDEKDRYVVKPDDVRNIFEYRTAQNETLNAFDETGKFKSYDNVKQIDYNLERQNVNNAVKSVGEIGFSTSVADTKKDGYVTTSINEVNGNTNNLIPLYQVIRNYSDLNSVEESDTKNFLYSEYVQYMKENKSIPLMTMKNYSDTELKEISETGSYTDKNGNKVGVFEFNIDYVLDEKGEVKRDYNITPEGYQSFVTNYIVSKANPNVKLISKKGEEAVASSNNTKQAYEDKVEVAEFDRLRAGFEASYAAAMSTTFNPRTVGFAVNTIMGKLSEFGVVLTDKEKAFFTDYVADANALHKYAAESDIPNLTDEQKKERKTTMDSMYQNIVTKRVAPILNLLVTKSGYDRMKDDDPLKKTTAKSIDKVWMELFMPATKGVYKSGFFQQSADWTTFMSDSKRFSSDKASKLKGDVYFANGQPIEQTNAKNGIRILTLDRYSPNFINYESTALSGGRYYKMYEADNDKMYEFFNASTINNDKITRETWETTSYMTKKEFDETEWYITDSKGKKIKKLGSKLTDEDKIQLNVLPQDDPTYKDLEVKDKGDIILMTAYHYKLHNLPVTGGNVKPLDRTIR